MDEGIADFLEAAADFPVQPDESCLPCASQALFLGRAFLADPESSRTGEKNRPYGFEFDPAG